MLGMAALRSPLKATPCTKQTRATQVTANQILFSTCKHLQNSYVVNTSVNVFVILVYVYVSWLCLCLLYVCQQSIPYFVLSGDFLTCLHFFCNVRMFLMFSTYLKFVFISTNVYIWSHYIYLDPGICNFYRLMGLV